MRRDRRVALSVIDHGDPYRMAMLQRRVIEERPDEGCRYMNPISRKYTGAPSPQPRQRLHGFVIAVERAAARTLDFVHSPA